MKDNWEAGDGSVDSRQTAPATVEDSVQDTVDQTKDRTATAAKNAAEAATAAECININFYSKEFIEIHITNTAPIPQHILPKLFQKYVTHGKIGGTGLGVYSARLMTLAQHGSLDVFSSPEVGTTVVVKLPRGVAG